MLCVKLDSIYIAAEKNICRMLGNDKLRVEKLKAQFEKRRCKTMSNNSGNRLVIPAAREAMDKFKMEAASEVGVNLKNGYNGELTARQAGSVGGQMVKKMCPVRTAKYERQNRIAIGHTQTVQYIAAISI